MADSKYTFSPEAFAKNNGYIVKVYNLSIRYYNEALIFANEGKYTEAAHSLRKSVALKKDNIQAQNLLGLVYYQLGRVTDAILHWQISLKYQKSKNDALGYIQDCSYNANEMRKVDAITEYNKALRYIKRDSVDLAVMALKKALEINPKFIVALNLMTLCHIKLGNTTAAIKLAERVLKLDKENEIATGYLKELKPDSNSRFKKKPKEYGSNKANSLFHNIASQAYAVHAFVAGLVCTAIVIGGLIMPAIYSNYKAQNEKQQLDYNVDINNKNDQISKNNEAIKRLTDENENLKSKLYTAGEQEVQQRVRTLADIETYYKEGSVGEASDKLLALSTSGFTKDGVDKYNQLKKLVLPAGARYYYELGTSSQSKNKNDDAKSYFEKCIKCTEGGNEIRYSAMYQLGKIAEESGDNNTAVKYFTTVADKHPVEAIKNEAKAFVENYRKQ